MPQKVVVIGGGYAGIEAAISLDKAFDVTLVAGGDSFRHFIFGLRASVLPEETPRMLPSYDNILKVSSTVVSGYAPIWLGTVCEQKSSGVLKWDGAHSAFKALGRKDRIYSIKSRLAVLPTHEDTTKYHFRARAGENQAQQTPRIFS